MAPAPRPSPRSRFLEGSMKDRVSHVPPSDFLGPEEAVAFEQASYQTMRLATATSPAKEDGFFFGRMQEAATERPTNSGGQQPQKKGFLAPLWDGIIQHLRKPKSSGCAEEEDAGGQKQGQRHVSALPTSMSPRGMQGPAYPTREEVMTSYKTLVAAGFFSAHAIQGTRHARPGQQRGGDHARDGGLRTYRQCAEDGERQDDNQLEEEAKNQMDMSDEEEDGVASRPPPSRAPPPPPRPSYRAVDRLTQPAATRAPSSRTRDTGHRHIAAVNDTIRPVVVQSDTPQPTPILSSIQVPTRQSSAMAAAESTSPSRGTKRSAAAATVDEEPLGSNEGGAVRKLVKKLRKSASRNTTHTSTSESSWRDPGSFVHHVNAPPAAARPTSSSTIADNGTCLSFGSVPAQLQHPSPFSCMVTTPTTTTTHFPTVAKTDVGLRGRKMAERASSHPGRIGRSGRTRGLTATVVVHQNPSVSQTPKQVSKMASKVSLCRTASDTCAASTTPPSPLGCGTADMLSNKTRTGRSDRGTSTRQRRGDSSGGGICGTISTPRSHKTSLYAHPGRGTSPDTGGVRRKASASCFGATLDLARQAAESKVEGNGRPALRHSYSFHYPHRLRASRPMVDPADRAAVSDVQHGIPVVPLIPNRFAAATETASSPRRNSNMMSSTFQGGDLGGAATTPAVVITHSPLPPSAASGLRKANWQRHGAEAQKNRDSGLAGEDVENCEDDAAGWGQEVDDDDGDCDMF